VRVGALIFATIHPIDFKLGGCIAEDPRKCSFECKAVCMRGSLGKLQAATLEAKRSAHFERPRH